MTRNETLQTIALLLGILTCAEAVSEGEVVSASRWLILPEPSRNTVTTQRLLEAVEESDRLKFQLNPNTPPTGNDLFNHYWLQQYQPNYESSVGGAALGKLLRQTLRSVYKQYRNGGGGGEYLPDADGRVRGYGLPSELDYQLRLSEDKIKFGVRYEF